MEEIWKDIEGYEGLYQVSNLGKVKSLNYNKTAKSELLKLRKNTNGYTRVVLYKNRKAKDYQVHRLVAEAFIPNPNNYPIINHKDENKTNNRVDNLEWCTYLYNNTYGTTIERAVEKRKGYKHSKEAREKISKANKGRKFTIEQKQKMSKSKKGNKNPMYGMTGNKNPMYGKVNEKNPRARRVICITTGQIFNTAKEAGIEMKTQSAHITSCCKGKRKSSGKLEDGTKLVWGYFDVKALEENK